MPNATATTPSDYPVSPCIQVCTLDAAQMCIGCRRTLEEIANWGRMSAAEQREVIAELPGRGR